MSKVHALTSFAALSLIVAGGALLVTSAFRSARAAGDHESKIELSGLPAPVQAAAKKYFSSFETCKASTEKEKGDTYFEIQGKGDGSADLSVLFTAAGQLVEVEREVPADRLPPAARAEIEKRHPGATVAKVEDLEKHSFEVKLVGKDGKKAEVEVSVTGRVGGDEDDEEDERK